MLPKGNYLRNMRVYYLDQHLHIRNGIIASGMRSSKPDFIRIQYACDVHVDDIFPDHLTALIAQHIRISQQREKLLLQMLDIEHELLEY